MRSPLDYDPAVAIEQLSAADEKLGRLIERVGPFALPTRERASPFQTLLRAIVYQQITGRAAASIHARLMALFPGGKPSPRALQALSDEALRAAGLSQPKQRAARDLAVKTLDGTVPTLRQLQHMDDDAIVERLVEVRGIGRWSAEMMLIFQLGRPDVLPATDLGVRKGFRLSHGGRGLPEPKKLLRHGERWRPYRSVASWYLWRANDLP
ncbi:MAG: DNA-3-methyladenine glycosylase 2 family protein [Gammaproteobacteria bacterium]|nr:DNA-3-methyladenine glycosylase 2 family protein [Gammaproteobacteria bacterium]NIM74491.1 DNA-3-methyladenine glycosylase 2 family protein [Gammaproteobacteria bacterium]NIO26324.1 DNA-3-methyladenine glycosylase 2 family protein [Gammaproteobacteria bacterium]NIO66876.1 DNA-3-methyladenine glycosylase 2 family protein [Gammaproteobacteria bacterium]NIP45187.1 DNA-3-methyladenine glycosylase 2 family protein [Gammaproteobacteria bacterium]